MNDAEQVGAALTAEMRAEMLALRERLAELLMEYGDHRVWCRTGYSRHGKCDCGWADARAALAAVEADAPHPTNGAGEV